MKSIHRACLVVLLVTPFSHARAQTPISTAMAVPSEDRDILAGLAPPSDRMTADGTYGDAVFARAQRKLPGRPETAHLQRRPPCFAGRPGTVYMRCSESGSAFFRRNYAFTPSNVSAPQVLQPSPSGRTNLLSPITSFFLDPFDQPGDPDQR